MNCEKFFFNFFEGDCLNVEVIELNEDLIITGIEEYRRINPFLNSISFINPNNKIIFKKIPLDKIEINNPSIIIEFNEYLSISKLKENFPNINVRSLHFNNCKLLPPDYIINFPNIVIENSELFGPMIFQSNIISFIGEIKISGSIHIIGNLQIMGQILVKYSNDNVNNHGSLTISSI